MKCRSLPSIFFSLGALFFSSSKAVTVYYEPGQAALTATATGAAANYTGAAAYNPTTLIAPSPPGLQAMPTQFSVQLNNAPPAGVSIQQRGSFFGFSIEMSVVNQVGKYITYRRTQFFTFFFLSKIISGNKCVRSGIFVELDYRHSCFLFCFLLARFCRFLS